MAEPTCASKVGGLRIGKAFLGGTACVLDLSVAGYGISVGTCARLATAEQAGCAVLYSKPIKNSRARGAARK